MNEYLELYKAADEARHYRSVVLPVLKSALHEARAAIADHLKLESATHPTFAEAVMYLAFTAAGSPGHWSNGPLSINNIEETLVREEALTLLRHSSQSSWQVLRDKYRETNNDKEVSQ